MTDGDVALDGEGDGAVDGADQRHVYHLSERNSILNAAAFLCEGRGQKSFFTIPEAGSLQRARKRPKLVHWWDGENAFS